MILENRFLIFLFITKTTLAKAVLKCETHSGNRGGMLDKRGGATEININKKSIYYYYIGSFGNMAIIFLIIFLTYLE